MASFDRALHVGLTVHDVDAERSVGTSEYWVSDSSSGLGYNRERRAYRVC